MVPDPPTLVDALPLKVNDHASFNVDTFALVIRELAASRVLFCSAFGYGHEAGEKSVAPIATRLSMQTELTTVATDIVEAIATTSARRRRDRASFDRRAA
jgi:hypothetical protein